MEFSACRFACFLEENDIVERGVERILDCADCDIRSARSAILVAVEVRRQEGRSAFVVCWIAGSINSP